MKQVAPGLLSISRLNTGDIEVEVRDQSSHTILMRISVTPETLGKVITGMAEQQCELTVYPMNRIGKFRQVKTVEIGTDVPLWSPPVVPEGHFQHLVAPYEKNGWEATLTDFRNKNNWYYTGESHDRRPVCRVMFTRYVDDKDQPDV